MIQIKHVYDLHGRVLVGKPNAILLLIYENCYSDIRFKDRLDTLFVKLTHLDFELVE